MSAVNDKNGVCPKNTAGDRDHKLTTKKDGMDREYESCDKCGFLKVVT